MCGIVGYIGIAQAAPILLDGLEKLEYRGYDSAGIAVYNGTGIQMVKATGRLKVLYNLTQGGASLPGTAGGLPTASPRTSTRIPISTRILQLQLYIMELLKII